jgi:predicted O-methyltransferase YrrM
MPDSARAALLERAALARSLLVRDPALLGDYARWFLASRLAQAEPPSPAPHVASLSLEAAHACIRATVGDFAPGPALALVRQTWRRPAARADAAAQAVSMAGDPSLGELVYGLVRALRPQVVVETGVATGVTSAYVLAALADNGAGRLYSIDLPPTRLVAAHLVGSAVPPPLRDRWTYLWGAARRRLPGLLASLNGGLQLFIHDSDHRYGPMRWELETAWRALAPGGWLVADDATLHSAVDDLAGLLQVQPLYVQQSDKPDSTALLQKPPTSDPIQEAAARAGGASRQLQPR